MKLLKGKTILIIFLLVVLFAGANYFLNDKQGTTAPALAPTASPQADLQTRIEFSEGTCNSDSDCKWIGEGCGGGHGICTSDQSKWGEDKVSTCDINTNHPSQQGYECKCLQQGECGWKQ